MLPFLLFPSSGHWQKAVNRRTWAEHQAGKRELSIGGPCSLLWPKATPSAWHHTSTSTCESGNNTHFPLPITSLFAQCWEILKLLLKLNDISFLEIPRMTVHQKKIWTWSGCPQMCCDRRLHCWWYCHSPGNWQSKDKWTKYTEWGNFWVLSRFKKLSPQNCFSFQKEYCDVEFCSPIVLCKTFVEN